MTHRKCLRDTLKDSKSTLYVACAGAGTDFLNCLFVEPGCSEYFAGGRVLYAQEDMYDFIGHRDVEHAVSLKTAIDLAMAAYVKAKECSGDRNAVGLGMTAAVATNRVRHGHASAYAAVITHDKVLSIYKYLHNGSVQGYTYREFDDSEITSELFDLLWVAIDKPEKLPFPTTLDCSELAFDLLHKHAIFCPEGTRYSTHEVEISPLYCPATLNPLHDGHRTLCDAGEETCTGHSATYLVSTRSPHKGDMSIQQILGIVAQVRKDRWADNGEYNPRNVEFTCKEPLFIDKARKRPGSTFLIGADTMQRMLDPKWGPDIVEMLNEMRNLKVTFYVRGREIDGKFVECRDIPVPFPYQLLFRPLPGRCDVSSTEVRNAQG